MARFSNFPILWLFDFSIDWYSDFPILWFFVFSFLRFFYFSNFRISNLSIFRLLAFLIFRFFDFSNFRIFAFLIFQFFDFQISYPNFHNSANYLPKYWPHKNGWFCEKSLILWKIDHSIVHDWNVLDGCWKPLDTSMYHAKCDAISAFNNSPSNCKNQNHCC